MNEPTSPTPRRIAAPRWFDPRVLLGAALVLGSVVVGAVVVSRAGRSYPAVAVTRDLAAGTVVSAAELRITQVRLPDRGRGVYLTRISDVAGRALSRPLGAGELVPTAALRIPSALTTVTVPLADSAAPALHAGQRIEVWVSTDRCASQVLLPDAVVQAVHADGGGSFGSSDGGQDVVLSLPPALADRAVAALALDHVQLRAGVLAGPRAPVAALPDLAGCASRTP